MQSVDGYLQKTESAVRLLFDGIATYLRILEEAPIPIFSGTGPRSPESEERFKEWFLANQENLEATRRAQESFLAEAFALDTLCGAILQVALKALELYSPGGTIPEHLRGKGSPSMAKFCVGRVLRSVPLGMVVYAGRNQHTHFNDGPLREPSASIFEFLATAHGYGSLRDPAFDLTNPRLVSYASNITALMGWRSYASFTDDLRSMLLR